MTCPVCHARIESGSAVCPRCGTQLVPTLSREQRKGGVPVTLILYVVAVALVAAFAAAILTWRDSQLDSPRVEQIAIEATTPQPEAARELTQRS